ncbi:ribosome biogenesis GTPase Der [Candidatus Nanosyncoccus alces]|uniref:GTPase Der n=1 Tax=Candidatus Nanosyncoccus alces TaxID=2171997 RepID=A0ABY0FQF2_9BACT|nr:ribosome biogenesis GTPase Der [Candidatus Nanosyncoccus alces]RYC75095.1 GTPase Der [Candidatus Nanosyncoccus alces]
MKKLPIIALIGQTNAGKSSILNRMARKNIAIVAREEGTTRDNVMATIDDSFILVDTAGLKDPNDDFEASIQDQIADAIDVADVILVTLDSARYFDHRDAKIAKDALRSGKPVYLVLNKCDLGDSLPITEFRALGVAPENIFYVSATTGQGISKLKDALPKGKISQKDDVLKIAFIGRPNVGKSSLFNSLAKKQQAIVSSLQGTTRDVNRVTVKYKGRDLEILDTAGLRKPGKREVGIEKFSAIRTLAAIEEADVCALLIDSTEPHSKLDQSLAGQIVEAGKGIIMVVTKSDLLDEATPTNYFGEENVGNRTAADFLIDSLEKDFDFLPYAPVLITSSETGENVTRLFELTLEIDKNRHTEIKTSDLNKILNEAIVLHPPAGLKNTRPKPKYIVQTDVCPPWFVVHGRELGLLHWSWKRFLERKIREKYPFVGTPIMFSYRSDKGKE